VSATCAEFERARAVERVAVAWHR